MLYCKGHMYYNEFYNHMVNSIWLYIIVIEKWNLKLYVSTSYGGIGLELSIHVWKVFENQSKVSKNGEFSSKLQSNILSNLKFWLESCFIHI